MSPSTIKRTATWVLYDERGVYDPGEASILEVFEAKDEWAAFRQAVQSWPDTGWALHKGFHGENLFAWNSPKRKLIVRWFCRWEEPRRYSYDGKWQKVKVAHA